MSTATQAAVSVQTHRVWIRATPEQIWEALTEPAIVARYGYGGRIECDWELGSTFLAHSTDAMKAMGAPDVMVDGEVIEIDAPRRLSLTWHPNFDAQIAAEPVSIVTYAIEPAANGVTKLTVLHDTEGAPRTDAVTSGAVAEAGGGWAFVLSDLKTLLETGAALPPQLG
jgi:uncharacterized protein YndB with AHSA1/START domain